MLTGVFTTGGTDFFFSWDRFFVKSKLLLLPICRTFEKIKIEAFRSVEHIETELRNLLHVNVNDSLVSCKHRSIYQFSILISCFGSNKARLSAQGLWSAFPSEKNKLVWLVFHLKILHSLFWRVDDSKLSRSHEWTSECCHYSQNQGNKHRVFSRFEQNYAFIRCWFIQTFNLTMYRLFEIAICLLNCSRVKNLDTFLQ